MTEQRVERQLGEQTPRCNFSVYLYFLIISSEKLLRVLKLRDLLFKTEEEYSCNICVIDVYLTEKTTYYACNKAYYDRISTTVLENS